jgi:hypothetical protein
LGDQRSAVEEAWHRSRLDSSEGGGLDMKDALLGVYGEAGLSVDGALGHESHCRIYRTEVARRAVGDMNCIFFCV